MKTQQQSYYLFWIQWNIDSEFSHQGLADFLWYLTNIISDKHLVFNKQTAFLLYMSFSFMVYHIELPFKPESLKVLQKLILFEIKHGEKRNCMKNIVFMCFSEGCGSHLVPPHLTGSSPAAPNVLS